MNWAYRMKRAFITFKRMVLPLYAWYLILAVAGLVLIILTLVPMFITLMRNGIFGPEISGIPGAPVPPFATPYPNPNPPVPPGSSYTPIPESFMDNLTPFLALAPEFLLTFAVLILLSWFLSSAFLTGLFHLTKKAYSTQAKFKDFRLVGISRVLGWYGILTLLGVLFISIGIGIAITLRNVDYALPVFAGVYVLFLVALTIFFTPWFSTSIFYMLNHRELTFGRSLRKSWAFYRRHIGSFWGYFLTTIAIQVIVVIVDHNSPNLGWIVSLFLIPFTSILPIVWVLTHDEEDNPLITDMPYTPASTIVDEPDYSNSQPYPSNNPDESDIKVDPAISQSKDYTAQDITTAVNTPQPPQNDTPQNHPLQKTHDDYPLRHNYPPQDSHDPLDPQDPPSLYTPQISTEENSHPHFCPTCGKSVRSGASYCSQCGTKL